MKGLEGVQGADKLGELLDCGYKKGRLSSGEMMEALESMSLDVPQITRVFLRLRELGVDVDPSVYTVEQAHQAIVALKGGAAHA